MSHRINNAWIALALGAALCAGPALAEKGGNGHGGDKHEGKAEKHAQKEMRKADKHDAKAEKHEAKADKHARKDFDKHDARERHAGRIMGAAPVSRTEVRVVPGAYFNDDHRRHARDYYVQNYRTARNCPPGLAKKNNGCMPPGQVRNFVVGQPLPRTITYYSVPQQVITYLPPAPYGYRYVRVYDDVVLMKTTDRVIIDVMLNLLG